MAFRASTRKELICLQKSDLCIYVVSNPGVTPDISTKVEHHRALPYAEVPSALASVRASDAWIGTRLFFEFLVLTAVRTNEVRGARWSEIDFPRATWSVPALRMKEREAHSVPLSSAALMVLREARDHADLAGVRRTSLNFHAGEFS